MALQARFFGKQETEAFNTRSNGLNNPNHSSGLAASSTANVTPAAAVPVSQPASAAPAVAPSAKDGGSKLTVGPNIKLKGVEITDCDTLVVEGLVEATMDSRVMQIAQQGAFKGSAEIDIAEIHGEFDGNLTVRQKLMIYSTGKVTGKIRYGKLVIEEGGQLAGEVEFGTASPAKAAPAKPALQAAA